MDSVAQAGGQRLVADRRGRCVRGKVHAGNQGVHAQHEFAVSRHPQHRGVITNAELHIITRDCLPRKKPLNNFELVS
jgi:hypothetical protein